MFKLFRKKAAEDINDDIEYDLEQSYAPKETQLTYGEALESVLEKLDTIEAKLNKLEKKVNAFSTKVNKLSSK